MVDKNREDLNLESERREDRKRYSIGRIFDECPDLESRIRNIILTIKPAVFDSGRVTQESIGNSLLDIVATEDRDKFIEDVFTFLQPLYSLGETLTGQKPLEIISINNAFDYELISGGRVVNLHLPATNIRGPQLLKLYKEGLTKLAAIINDNPDIIEITADSWIIDKNPGLVERFGFKIKDAPGERVWSRTAIISREDFLKKYL